MNYRRGAEKARRMRGESVNSTGCDVTSRIGCDKIRVRSGMQTTPAIGVTIERILPGGVGLAHAQGRTLFVALAAPGDVVRVRLDQIRDKLAFASIEEIVTPSPVRVEPPCPY